MNLSQILIRLGISLTLLVALGEVSERLLSYWQAPNIFGGVAAFMTFIGASFPILTVIKDSKSQD